MCQDAKVSLIAWAVATVIALLIITKGKKNGIWNGFFILVFILIQLLEFFIWWERQKEGLTSSAEEAKKEGPQSVKNKASGEAFVRLILIGLWLQPLTQTFMAYRYGNQKYSSLLLAFTITYFVLFIWSILKALDSTIKFEAHPGPNGHLIWTRSDQSSFVGGKPLELFYLGGLALGLFFMQPSLFGIMLLILGGILGMYTGKNYGKGQFASMWCLYAVLYAILALIIAFSRRSSVKQ
jgi:hypothetical protein